MGKDARSYVPFTTEFGIQVADKISKNISTATDIKTTVARQLLLKGLNSRLVFPTEVISHNNAIEEARALRHDGYGIIVNYNHYSYRDPIDVMSTLLSLGEGFSDAQYLSPLAMHQTGPHLSLMSSLTDIPLSVIVTNDTVTKGKNIIEPTYLDKAKAIFDRSRDIQPQVVAENHGLREYIDQGAQVLADGGIVFVAPQGGRRNQLGEPAGRANDFLITSAKRKGAEKIAIWIMGMTLDGQSTYDSRTAKYNVGKKAKIEFGIPVTIDEIRNLARENTPDGERISIDQQVFREFRQLLPVSYTGTKT